MSGLDPAWQDRDYMNTTKCSRCGDEFSFWQRDVRGRCLDCAEKIAAIESEALSKISAESEEKRVARRRKRLLRPWTRHSWVYKLRDSDGLLLYVGKTNHPYKRFYDSRTAHFATKSWWSDVATIETICYENEKTALTAELHFIHWEDPKYNVVRNPPKTKTEPVPIISITGSV